ncbi:DNA polymerase III subunit gamma/tau [Flavobacterium nackdongense]|nr:DNA polymerase III subunit gamma/tau [Flavobacterium nackdongense]
MQNTKVTEPKVEVIPSDVIVPAETTNSQQRTSDNELVKQTSNLTEGPKFSALSLSSIRAKRELLESTKGIVKEEVHLPTEPFNETDMLLQWSKYAQRLGDKGHKIMESLLLISDPKLEGTTITHELPNDSTKIEFESEKLELLGYLRGKLHNHDITIDVVVNEKVENKFAFTPLDKYNRLNEINPNLELLKRTFDLDI